MNLCMYLFIYEINVIHLCLLLCKFKVYAVCVLQGYEHGKGHSKDIHTTTNGRWLTYNGLVEPATKEELSLVWQMCMSAKAVSCADICVWVACMLKFGLENHVVWIVFLICRIPFKRSLVLVRTNGRKMHFIYTDTQQELIKTIRKLRGNSNNTLKRNTLKSLWF